MIVMYEKNDYRIKDIQRKIETKKLSRIMEQTDENSNYLIFAQEQRPYECMTQDVIISKLSRNKFESNIQ